MWKYPTGRGWASMSTRIASGATAATSRTGMWHSRRDNDIETWEDAMQDRSTRVGSWRRRLCAGALAAALPLAFAAPAGAAEKVKMSTFQANLCCFTVYVAKAMGLFDKHGVDVE